MNPEPDSRNEHEQVIALLKEVQEPPADAETPSLPDEVLESLRGQYGRAQRRVILEAKPSFWECLRALFVQPKFAFALALVLLCGVTAVMLRSPGPDEDMLRGGQPRKAAVAAYWVQSGAAEPVTTGVGMPPRIAILSDSAQVPGKGRAVVFYPARGSAQAILDGVVIKDMPISDPLDSNECAAVYRQLSKLLAP